MNTFIKQFQNLKLLSRGTNLIECNPSYENFTQASGFMDVGFMGVGS